MAERSEPRRVFLEPGCVIDHGGSDRLWCEDDVWGDCDECGCPSPEYIRADVVAELIAALSRAEGWFQSRLLGVALGGTTQERLDDIRAALAKAEGRTDQ